MPVRQFTGQFKKDIMKNKKSGNKNMNKLKSVVRKFIEDTPLETGAGGG